MRAWDGWANRLITGRIAELDGYRFAIYNTLIPGIGAHRVD